MRLPLVCENLLYGGVIMKVPYFKKKKMYELVSEFLPDMEIPKLIQCEYKFYRGSEWLKFSCCKKDTADSVVFVNLYHCGYCVVLDLEYRRAFEYDETEKKFRVSKRVFYMQPDNSLKLDYESDYLL